MSWFYPLQKLLGHEVGPEDPLSIDIAQQEADEATKKAAIWEERTKDKLYIPSWERIPRNITRRRSERKQDTLLRKQENIQAGRHTDRDMDILISRQKDPNIREYQEKAIAEKRFQDTAFKLGVGPRGQSVYSTTDPYMPKITDIQKQHKVEPNQIQAAVVKEIDAWNQANRIRNRRNEFRGPMPSPKRLMGDKYDKTKRYEWQNTGKDIASILDLSEKDLERFKDEDTPVFSQGAYSTYQDRIEWKEPITNDERRTIAHEQLHRFIKKHPSGKAFRNLDGDHELFVRAYTHLLDGGRLDDPELMVDLESAVGKYSDINLDRFLKDVPRKIQAFERAVLGADYGEPIKRESWLPEIVVTATRPKAVEDQMEYLLSPIKQNEYFPTFIENLKLRESDHGNTPMPTNDDKEKHLPKNQKTLDIAYGHKIKPHELAAGEIYGIKFRDSNGNYIPLTDKNKIFILEQDVYRETDEALEASWNKKLADRGLVWEDLPNKYKYPLMDLAFNTGAETAKQWTDIFDDVKNNNDKSFVKNLRREGGAGTWTKGMDNRVAKVAYKNGLVDSLKQAKEYGLKLADTNDIPLGKKDYTPVPSSLLQSILNK
jgi:hypothetical protein